MNLNYAEAAKVLRVSVPTLKRRVAEKSVPHLRIGRKVVFPLGVLEAWIADEARGSLRTVPVGALVDPVRRRRRIVQPTTQPGTTRGGVA